MYTYPFLPIKTTIFVNKKYKRNSLSHNIINLNKEEYGFNLSKDKESGDQEAPAPPSLLYNILNVSTIDKKYEKE